MTIFMKILRGEIPCTKVYENEWVLAFDDVSPVAPVHVLVIPKIEVAGLNAIDASHTRMLGEILQAAKEVARIKGIVDSGYRVVMNTGPTSSQGMPLGTS